jgi:hypothetical protein
MKNLNLLTDQQIEWCDKNIIDKKYEVNDEGKVVLTSQFPSLFIKNIDPELTLSFHVQFASTQNDFICANRELISLEGSPTEVDGNFSCYRNKLFSLEGAPRKVGKSFNCFNNKLISLKGAPAEVGGNFDCDDNQLTSLMGSPTEVKGNFVISGDDLLSFEYAPKNVGGNFVVTHRRYGDDRNELSVLYKLTPLQIEAEIRAVSNVKGDVIIARHNRNSDDVYTNTTFYNTRVMKYPDEIQILEIYNRGKIKKGVYGRNTKSRFENDINNLIAEKKNSNYVDLYIEVTPDNIYEMFFLRDSLRTVGGVEMQGIRFIDFGTHPPENWTSHTVLENTTEIYINYEIIYSKLFRKLNSSLFDVYEDERIKYTKELERHNKFLASVMKKLDNKKFMENAPEDIIDKELQKKETALREIEHYESMIKSHAAPHNPFEKWNMDSLDSYNDEEKYELWLLIESTLSKLDLLDYLGQKFNEQTVKDNIKPRDLNSPNLSLLTNEQIEWCNNHLTPEKWFVNKQGHISTEVGCELIKHDEITKIPVRFADDLNREFRFSSPVSTLKGSPNIMWADFVCLSKNLLSLEGCPEYVNGNFTIHMGNPISLEFLPKYIRKNFIIKKHSGDKRLSRPEVMQLENEIKARCEIGGELIFQYEDPRKDDRGWN